MTVVLESSEDRVRMRRLYWRWFWRSAYGLVFFALILFAVVGSVAVGLGTRSWVSAVIILIILAALTYRIFGPTFVSLGSRIDRASPVAPATYVFSDDGISIRRADRVANVTWDSIKSVIEYPEGFVFYAKPRVFFTFKSDSADEMDLRDVRGLLRAHLISRASLMP